MANIAIIPDPVTSKVITTVEMARRLRAAGHDVTFIVAEPSAFVDEFPFRQLDLRLQPLSLPRDESSGVARLASRIRAAFEVASARRRAIHASELDRLATLVTELDTDLLLADVEAHEYVIASDAVDVPVALISVFFNIWKRPGTAPLSSSVVPGAGVGGSRLGLQLSWLKMRAWKWTKLRRRFIRARGTDPFSLLAALARHRGLRRDQLAHGSWLIPWAYPNADMLTLNAVELEFPHEPHPRSHYVGPMTSVDRSHLSHLAEGSPDDHLARLLDRSSSADDRRLVYCTFGSYFSGDDTPFLRTIAAVARNRPDWDVVIALGSRVDQACLGPLPDNVTCLSWAPQIDILQAADAAVIHGGMTTVYECVRFGVPMVVYPFDTNDQSGTGARVEYHGVGVVGDRLGDDASRIERRITTVLGDAAMAARIATVRRAIDRYRKDDVLAATVDRLITEGTSAI